MKKEKKKIFAIVVLIVLLSTFGISYAYWIQTRTQTSRNTLNSECFKVTILNESEGITLNNAYPINEEEAQKLEGYSFTIQNICDSLALYQVNLEEIKLPEETKRLNGKFINVSLNGSKAKKLTLFNEVEPTITEPVVTDESHKLATGLLKPNESKNFNLKIWMGDDTPSTDETMNAYFKSKVTIINSYLENENNEILIDINSKNENYSKESETIEFHAMSKLYDLKEYSFDGEEYFPIENPGVQEYTFEKKYDKEGTYTIYFKDVEDNITFNEFETTLLDQEGPKITVTKESEKIKIKFEDSKSGNKSYKIEDGSEEKWIDLTGNISEVEYTPSNNAIIFITVKDNVDNESKTDYYTLGNDENKPQVNVTHSLTDNWGISDNIQLDLSDEESGIKEIKILKDDEEFYYEKLEVASTTYQLQKELKENGNYKIIIKDLAGNETSEEFIVDKIDKNPPIIDGDIIVDGSTVTIDLTKSNDNEMDIKNYEYCIDENCIISDEATHVYEQLSGYHDIVARVYDQNDNSSEIKKEHLLVDPVAKIEDTTYETLQNAINASTQDQTIIVLKNIEENVEVSDEKDITIDLNQFTITSNSEEVPIINNLGKVTITNGNLNANFYAAIISYGTTVINGGTITGGGNTIQINENSIVTIKGTNTIIKSNTTNDEPTILINAGGELNVEEGTINSENSYTINSYGTTNINGGTITGATNTIYIHTGSVVTIKGANTIIGGEDVNTSSYPTIWVDSGGELKVEEGKITSQNSNAIYNHANGTVTISGSTITSSIEPAIHSYGTTTINDGTITSASNAVATYDGVVTINGENVEINGIASEDTYPTIAALENGELKIEKGTITSQNGTTISSFSTVNITGGTIIGEKETIWVDKNGTLNIQGGTVTSHNSSAIRTTENTTVTISGGEISSDSVIAIQSHGITNITGGTITGSENAIDVKAGTVTIAGANTTIKCNETQKYSTIWVYEGGTLNIENGTITSQNERSVIHNSVTGNVTISGGEITSDGGLAIDSYGTTNINGGTITGATNTIKIQDGSTVTIKGQNAIIGGKDIDTGKYPTIWVYEGGTLNVEEGTITSQNSNAIYNAKAGNVTISGGEITSDNSAAIDSHGTMNITGGTIKGTTNTIQIHDSSTVTIKGKNTIIGGKDTNTDTDSYPTIFVYNGGTLNFEDGKVTSEHSSAIYNSETGNVTISGGEITSNGNSTISNYGTMNIKGQNPIINSNTAGGYATIYAYEGGILNIEEGTINAQDGIAVASYSTVNITGGNITSQNSAAIYTSETGNVTISGGKMTSENLYTIISYGTTNVKGKNTIINSNATGNYPAIWAYDGGRLTVEDGKITSQNSFAIYTGETGNVTISGGEITSENLVAIDSHGTTNITGGTIIGGENAIDIKSGTVTVDGANTVIKCNEKQEYATIYVYSQGNLEIKNGLIESGNFSAISIKGKTTISGPATIRNNSSDHSTIFIYEVDGAQYIKQDNCGVNIQNTGGGNLEYRKTS